MTSHQTPVVNPQHDCRGVARPELGLSEDGRQLFTAGVGLPILLGAVAQPGVTWFSRTTGEHADVTLVLVTRFPVPAKIMSQRLSNGPVAGFLGDSGIVDEYELTDRILAHFGTDVQTMDVDLAEYPNTWALGSHDEHWSGLNPMGETILRRVLVGLLGQVSFVLGRDVDWGNVADALLDVMQPGVSLRLDARARAVRRGVVHVGVREQGQKLRLRERVLGGRRLSSHRTVAHIHLDETPARFDAMTTAPS